MSLENQLIALAQTIGSDIKSLNIKTGDLTSLTTTNKSSLVLAINEIRSELDISGVQINDSAGTGNTDDTWSANKIIETIQQAQLQVKQDIIGSAPEALDTLAELAQALNNSPSLAAELATQMNNRVRFDDDQVLTSAQKLQACTNIGIGDPEVDVVSTYLTAKA